MNHLEAASLGCRRPELAAHHLSVRAIVSQDGDLLVGVQAQVAHHPKACCRQVAFVKKYRPGIAPFAHRFERHQRIASGHDGHFAPLGDQGARIHQGRRA